MKASVIITSLLICVPIVVSSNEMYNGNEFDGGWKGSAYPKQRSSCALGTVEFEIDGPKIVGTVKFTTRNYGVHQSSAVGVIYDDNTIEISLNAESEYARTSVARGSITSKKLKAYDDGNRCDYNLSAKRK